MSLLAILVLATLGVSTLMLILYDWLILPRRLEDEIRGSLRVFSTAIELRFPSHRGLTDRVIGLSRAVGQQMGLAKSQIADLETSALLRDIGLCAVPYRLINETNFHRWGEDYPDIYDRHAEVSATMLELIPSLRRYARIVRCHHASEASVLEESFIPVRSSFPIESLILDVVTAYTWAERVQGDLIAREILREGRGHSYDEAVVDAFLGVLTSGRVREVAEVAPVS